MSTQKKLVLYSDQFDSQSNKIDRELMNLLATKEPKIGYIPSSSDLTRKYYQQRVEYYQRMGINNIMYFDLDAEFKDNNIKDVLSCDAIHLAGGNTFYFLHSIRKRSFLMPLLNYVYNGGILIGVSAGSILMSNTISAAQIGDRNSIGLENLEALGLVNFDFFPHWNNDDDYLKKIIEYSRIKKDKVCYVCKDSDGIIINNNVQKFIGSPLIVLNGKVDKV
ncbi:MAG: Type 1 glutamine amidotransferase-like domain-containing protein [Halanaerobiales bacterium]|nr:Type 1 glutamine amidotransferase-like domain-containing protein [Halanaerobiales bacterium]